MFFSLYQQQKDKLAPRKKGAGAAVMPSTTPFGWPAEYHRGLKIHTAKANSLVIGAPAAMAPPPPPPSVEAMEAEAREKAKEKAQAGAQGDVLGDVAAQEGAEATPSSPQPFLAEVSLATLGTLPQTKQSRWWVSAQGWCVKATWQGVLLADLLAHLNLSLPPTPSQVSSLAVRQVNATGAEEWLALESLLTNKALLCTHVEDTPLPGLHGGPLRLISFPHYSYKSLANLSQLHLCVLPNPPQTPSGYWSQRGYEAEGLIQPGDFYSFTDGRTHTHPHVGEMGL